MPAPIPSNASGFFDYQFHQTAIYCPEGIEQAIEAVERYSSLGYDNWITDRAQLKGLLQNRDGSIDEVVTDAFMAFSYEIMPMELEFLAYEGPSRHTQSIVRRGDPYISHMSVYVDDVRAEASALLSQEDMYPYHRFITQGHTNPGVVGKKRFIECIYDTREFFGYDIKLIQKVAWDFNDDDWLGYQL